MRGLGLRLRLGQEARQCVDGDDQLAEIGGAGRGNLAQLVVNGGSQGGNQLAP